MLSLSQHSYDFFSRLRRDSRYPTANLYLGFFSFVAPLATNLSLLMHPNSLLKTQRSALLTLGIFLLCFGCAQTGVRLVGHTIETKLPAPARVLVYDFAVDANDVKEYQGILRQQPSIKEPLERQRAIAKVVSNALTAELVGGLRRLGMRVERSARDVEPAETDLLIDGRFLQVDEGSPFKRLVFGLGSGTSRVETRVQVFQGAQLRKLLEFTTHSESSKMPGAALTVPATAAAPIGASISLGAANAASTGFKPDSDEVVPMAGSSGDQAVRYLSEFFARQGWIPPDRVRRARIAY
ncbi:MAG: DUF4410 domain-containing protein [Deltaproteobacteria bacterium]|nr:DUF4410 domain-containing protein [Deltaproteobacteria bacterium]MBM4298462.1 DUF4410 domain-containing protein [Deltaproteobacteria bacterium]